MPIGTCSLLFVPVILTCKTFDQASGLIAQTSPKTTLGAVSVSADEDVDLPLLPQAARRAYILQGTTKLPREEQKMSTSFAQVPEHAAARPPQVSQEQAPFSADKVQSLTQPLVAGNATKGKPASSAAARLPPKSRNQDAMEALYNAVLGPDSGYNKKLRPLPDCSVYDCSHRISAWLGIGFTKMLGVDEKKNQIKMLGVMTMRWPDYRLDYDAVHHMPSSMNWNSMQDWIPVDSDLVWMPDIQLVNAAEPVKESFHPRAYLYDEVKRKKHGYNVVYQRPVALTVKCKLVYDQFPFDKHTCPFFFRSWSANTAWIHLQGMEDPPQLFSSPGWETSEALSDKNEEFDLKYINMSMALVKSGRHGKAEQAFAEVVYAVHIERFSHYYMCVIVLPMALMIMFSLGVFYIDPERGERLGVSMTLLLTVMAMSFFTADSIPKSGGGDTWLQIFQSYAYVLTMFPLFVSLALELVRRIWIQRLKSAKLEAGLDFNEDDVDVDWIDFRLDHVLRLPYACGVVGFLVWVFWKYMVTCQQREVSVEVMLFFLCFLSLGMLLLPIVAIFIAMKGGHDWHNMEKFGYVFQSPRRSNSERNVCDQASK